MTKTLEQVLTELEVALSEQRTRTRIAEERGAFGHVFESGVRVGLNEAIEIVRRAVQ